jgi:hypothetical protein
LDQYIEKTNLTINTILNSEGNLLKLEHQAFVRNEFLRANDIGLGANALLCNNHEVVVGENVSSIYQRRLLKHYSIDVFKQK